MSKIVGQPVIRVRKMTKAEADKEGWYPYDINGAPYVIVLGNGVRIYPSRDPEGNGPGTLFGNIEGDAVYVRGGM